MWRRKREELNEELQSHLKMAASDRMERGEKLEEARGAALRELGNLGLIKEVTHEVWGWSSVERLVQDVRYGVRMLVKSPGFALIAVLTLALGVGANTALFSVINAVLLRPLQFPEADRLVLLWQVQATDPTDLGIVSAPNFKDWQRLSQSFQSMALFDSGGNGYDLSGDGKPESVSGVRVTAGFFDVFGVNPMLGRTFQPEEEVLGNDHEVILSHGLWKRRFGSDPNILDKTIQINKIGYRVVGVMPSAFHFQFWGYGRELWVPTGYTEGDKGRGSHSFVACARLKHGVTLARARAEMDSIGRQLSALYPTDNPGQGVSVTSMNDFGLEEIQRTLIALQLAVGLVLLIACVNVANLTLARNAARRKELAVRRALGASRLRLARQLMTESVLLAMLGGIAGLLLAQGAVQVLENNLPPNLQFLPLRRLDTISMGGTVFLFALVVSCLTGILFGLAPLFRAQKVDVNESLKEGGQHGATQLSGGRLRHSLVATEIALALMVLAAAGLMIESTARVLGVAPGFDAKNLLTAWVSEPQDNLYYGPPVNQRFCQELEENIGSVPGVLSVSATSGLPTEGSAGRGFTIEGRPDPGPRNMAGASYSVACPGYFKSMRIPLIEGREFTHEDTMGTSGVIVINQTMAHQYWPKEVPLGKRIKIGGFNSDSPWLTIVGVAGDIHRWGLDAAIRPEFIRPFPQAGWPSMAVVVRTAGAPERFEAAVQEAFHRIDPRQALSLLEAMEDVMRDSVGSRRYPMLLLVAFACLGVTLAAVGISGVASFVVKQRTHEIGVRMALGARPVDALRLVVGDSMKWGVGGVAAGIVGALFATRLLSGLLFGVRPTDPVVLTAVSLLLTGVALVASYIPARCAAKVDPVVALRYE